MHERLRLGSHNPLLTAVLLLAAIVFVRWPLAWTANEENYFLLAHRVADPSAYGPFDAGFDDSRGKWLGFATFGWAVSLLGFEAAHKVIALLSFLVTAAGLAAVARMLRLGALQAVATLLIFVGLGESIVGGEWFIGGVETKAFAYGFGMLALAAAGSGRSVLAAALTALGAYFHFLVGGFWLVCVGLFLANRHGWDARLRQFAIPSALLLAPLLIALGASAVEAASAVRPAGSPSYDHIYSVLRAPHHVAPFAAVGGWPWKALLAAALGLGMAPIAWLAAARHDGALRALLRTLAALALILPVAVLLSWFDRESLSLGKFYLFRPASPLLLLTLLGGCAVAARLLERFAWSWLVWPVLIAGAATSIAVRGGRFAPPPELATIAPLADAIRSNTRPDQVVLVDPALERRGLAGHAFAGLPRHLGRPTYVSWKFVPTNPNDIYRWYDRLERRRKFFENGCPTSRQIGALVMSRTTFGTKANCGRLIYVDERVAVLAVTPAPASAVVPVTPKGQLSGGA